MRPAPRGRSQVVGVHDDVDEGVQDAPEGDVQEGHLQVRGGIEIPVVFLRKKRESHVWKVIFFLWKGEIHCKKYGFKTFRSLKAFAMRKTSCEKTCKLYWF